MKPVASRRNLFNRTTAILGDAERLAGVQSAVPPPDPVVQFLAQLELLNGVPFNYLVPDEGMLPAESIRFFQVDPNWIYALIEGAAGIGCVSSSDAAHDAVTRPLLHGVSTRMARSVRARKDPAIGADTPLPLQTSGFLLRSAVVSGWPGLEVTAYDKNDNILPVIRMERVAPAILLYWAEGIIDHVEIHEPPEGMHFGIDVLGGKVLRYVTVPANAPPHTCPGMTIEHSSQPIPTRAANVIKVDALASTLKQELQNYNANQDAEGHARPFTSAEFALQMVEGAQAVVFINVPANQEQSH